MTEWQRLVAALRALPQAAPPQARGDVGEGAEGERYAAPQGGGAPAGAASADPQASASETDGREGGDSDDAALDLVERLLSVAQRAAGDTSDDVADALLLVADRLSASRTDSRAPADLLADTARLLAAVAPPGREDVVDRLSAWWAAGRNDVFLGPEMLHALTVYAERDDSALDTCRLLFRRLDLTRDEPAVCVQAAKAVGRLECRGRDTGARERLRTWVDAEDAGIRGEARYQLGTLALNDALRAPALPQFDAHLREARLAFDRAAHTEEQRPDAEWGRGLAELLLAYTSADVTTPVGAESVRVAARALLGALGRRGRRVWAGYATRREAVLEFRIAHVAVGFSRLAEHVGDAEWWFDFDLEAEHVAAALHVMTVGAASDEDEPESAREPMPDGAAAAASEGAQPPGGAAAAPPTAYEGSDLSDRLRALPRAVVIPRLGPLLGRAVRRARLQRLLAHRLATTGEDEVTHTLHELIQADQAAEGAGAGAPGGQAAPARGGAPTAGTVAAVVGDTAAQFLRALEATPAAIAALEPILGEELARWRAAVGGLGASPAAGAGALALGSTDTLRLGLFGDDPDTDEAIRDLLPALWARLGGYPAESWHDVRALLVALVGFVRDLQDELPEFTRSALEPGGMGTTATEADLQAYLYQRLRPIYRHRVLQEVRGIAGGRVDLLVQLTHVDVPIEVKASHQDVSPEYIRTHFLEQTDAYATARHRIAVLMVLDLREANAASHRDARPRRQRGAALPSTPDHVPRYSVRQAFWVDSLPLSPAQPRLGASAVAPGNALVIGLVQGNLPRPSSTSRYSRARA